MRSLSLFSGIGGLDLGLERAGFEIVAAVEKEPYPQAVLAERFPDTKIFDDVREVTGETVRSLGGVDAIVGGFPCQDVSSAGAGAGLDGERSGLWFEMLRIIREVEPLVVIAENVPALRARGIDRVLEGLYRQGYSGGAFVVGARDVLAPHRRDRVFILGIRDGDDRLTDATIAGKYRTTEGVGETTGFKGVPRYKTPPTFRRGDSAGSDGDDRLADASGNALRLESERYQRRRGEERAPERGNAEPGDDGAGLADATSKRGWENRVESELRAGLPRKSSRDRGETNPSKGAEGRQHRAELAGRWPTGPGEPQAEWEPRRTTRRSASPLAELGGGAYGVPDRLLPRLRNQRLKALGNAVVPQVGEIVGRAVLAALAKAGEIDGA